MNCIHLNYLSEYVWPVDRRDHLTNCVVKWFKWSNFRFIRGHEVAPPQLSNGLARRCSLVSVAALPGIERWPPRTSFCGAAHRRSGRGLPDHAAPALGPLGTRE